MRRLKVMIPILVASCGILGWSQQKPAEDRAMTAEPMSGPELYQVFCATCHGADAKGKGPAAAAMKKTVPDLTVLSKKNGGKFPLLKVEQEIQADDIAAHGSREMPVYGAMFRDVKREETFVKQRIGLLTGYLQSLQAK